MGLASNGTVTFLSSVCTGSAGIIFFFSRLAWMRPKYLLMSFIGRIEKLFVQFAIRIRFDTLSSFFHHDITFCIKFAKDGIEQPVSFYSCPKFNFIGWQADLISCCLLYTSDA